MVLDLLSLVSMPKALIATIALDELTRKLAYLARFAPDEVKAVETLVDEAIARHREEASLRRRLMFSRVK